MLGAKKEEEEEEEEEGEERTKGCGAAENLWRIFPVHIYDLVERCLGNQTSIYKLIPNPSSRIAANYYSRIANKGWLAARRHGGFGGGEENNS